MGAHPAIYSALQLHVVNLNQNVLKWFKLRKQMNKWCEENCQEPHTFSYEIRFSMWEGVKQSGEVFFFPFI